MILARVQTQLSHQSTIETRQCVEECFCGFIVSCSDAPRLCEAAKHSLDLVALFVAAWFEWMWVVAGFLVGNDWFRFPLFEPCSQVVAIVSLVRQ